MSVFELRKIQIHGIVVLGTIVLTLWVTQFVRQNISDLRSYSEIKDVKKVIEVNSVKQKVSFEIGKICKPLEKVQHVLIIDISGYLEFSEDDVEILSMSNDETGLRIVTNEARQLIVYFTDPDSGTNVKGYELGPTLEEHFQQVMTPSIELSKFDVRISISNLSGDLKNKTIIMSTFEKPYKTHQIDLVQTQDSNTAYCQEFGTIGSSEHKNSFNVVFSSGKIDEENIGVLRNLRAHAAVLILSVCSVILVLIWLRQRPRTQ